MNTKLPFWVWWAVGAFVILYSRFISWQRPGAHLALFYWVGAMFIGFGFAVLIFDYFVRRGAGVVKEENDARAQDAVQKTESRGTK